MRLLPLAVGLGGLAALTGQARGDTPNVPLEFRSAAVSLTWEKLIAKPRPKAVELLNDSGRERTVIFAVSRLATADGRQLCQGCVHASIDNPLAPGGHRQVEMWALPPKQTKPAAITPPGKKNEKAKLVPPPGTYSGTLVAYVEESDIAVRLPLTITVGTAATVAATPLIDSVTTTVHCYVPSFIAALSRIGPFPRVGRHCSRGLKVWIPLKADVDPGAKGAKLALASGGIGSVDGDHGNAIVKYKGGETKDVATGNAIPVEIVGLTKAGEYEGKVDLVADPEDKVGTVTIKAIVSDAWGWAVLPVLAGTLAALALLRYSGLARASFNLNLRRWEALDAIDKATAKVASATGKPWAGTNITQAATDKSTEISTKINELGHLSFSEGDAKKVAEIEAALAALTTAVANLDTLAGMMPKLELARDSLSRRASPLPQTVPAHSGAPPLAAEAKNLLEPTALSLDDLNALMSTKVPDMLKLIGDWQSRERDVADYERALEAIDRPNLPDDERKKILDDARQCLSGVWNRLWDATTASEFATEEIDKDLARVHRSVSDLHGAPHHPHLGTMLSYARARTTALLPDWGNLVLADVLRADLALGQESSGGAPPATIPAKVPTETTIKHLRSEGRKRELVLLVLGFVIALLTALKALYFGKAWGTWFDYVDAVLWALTATAALTLLLVPTLDQLAKLRPLGKLIQR
jgi:hypothetical protein